MQILNTSFTYQVVSNEYLVVFLFLLLKFKISNTKRKILHFKANIIMFIQAKSEINCFPIGR